VYVVAYHLREFSDREVLTDADVDVFRRVISAA
jgi:hypothetical protein